MPCRVGERDWRGVVFGWYIIAYLFVAGAGSGAFFVAFATCLWDLVRKSPASERAAAAVQPGFYLAPVLGAFSILLLVLDLGNPDRILPLVMNPLASIVGVGAWLLGLFALLSGLLAAFSLVVREVPRWLLALLGTPACLCAVGVMSYTGVLLSTMVSIDFWYSPWLVAVFVLSSLTTGAAAIVATETITGTPAAHQNLLGLWRASGVLTALEAIALLVFLLLQAHGAPQAIESVRQLTLGTLALPFWGGVVAAGFLIPWAMHGLRRLTGRAPALLISSMGVLMGGFMLRYCIVGAGLYSPLVLSSVALGL